MQRTFFTSLTLGSLALVLSACGPSAEEVQEEKEALFRGKFTTSCISANTSNGVPPAIAGELCDCSAREVLDQIGLPESPDAELPQETVDAILQTCTAAANAAAEG